MSPEPRGDAVARVPWTRWTTSVPVVLAWLALLGGARLSVDAAVEIALALGVSEVVIGLTVLAVGTSLPELVASLMATMRQQVELAVGNVVGSNIFNLLLVAGITSTVRPIPVPPGGLVDICVVAVLSVVLFFVCMTNRRVILRTEAIFLLATYCTYIVWRSLG